MERVLLVTGGSSGIGAAVAKLAAKAHFTVCVCYRSNELQAAELTELLRADGAKAIAVKADVSSEVDVLRLFSEIDNKLGVITHLVNNAGIISPIKKFEETSLEQLQSVFSVNVFGSFLCARER